MLIEQMEQAFSSKTISSSLSSSLRNALKDTDAATIAGALCDNACKHNNKELKEWCDKIAFIAMLAPENKIVAIVKEFVLSLSEEMSVGTKNPVVVRTIYVTPDKNLRMPIYNLEGDASITSMGEIWPKRIVCASIEFQKALMNAFIAHKAGGKLVSSLIEEGFPVQHLETVKMSIEDIKMNRTRVGY